MNWIKDKLFLFISIAICLFLVFSCSNGGYLVYTFTDLYTDVQKSGITIQDGYYIKLPLSSEQYNSMPKSQIPNDCIHHWSRDQIRDWFRGRDFSENEAEALTKYLLSENHAIVYSRSGVLVYSIIK